MVKNLGFFVVDVGRCLKQYELISHLTAPMKHFELSPIADYIKLQTLSTIAISIDNFSAGDGLSEQPLVSQDSGKKTGQKKSFFVKTLKVFRN